MQVLDQWTQRSAGRIDLLQIPSPINPPVLLDCSKSFHRACIEDADARLRSGQYGETNSPITPVVVVMYIIVWTVPLTTFLITMAIL